MVNFKRRLQSGSDPNKLDDKSQRDASGQRSGPAQRIAAYGVSAREPTPAEDHEEASVGPSGDEGATQTEAPARNDFRAFGEEVGAVLESAREAASSIRLNAEEDAARIRAEAESTVAAEAAEAKRAAEADRANAERMRTEAEAYAQETRAAADAFLDKRRSEAAKEAERTAQEASRRLEGADAEAERRLREADEKSRERVTALETEAAQYEERLQSMIAIFRGMASQLEEVLGSKQTEGGEQTSSATELEDALKPGSRARA
jgi:hypothetical protein